MEDLVAFLVEGEATSYEDAQDGFAGIPMRLKVLADLRTTELANILNVVQSAVQDGW